MQRQLRHIFSQIHTHRVWMFSGVLCLWIMYAVQEVQPHEAAASTTWMHVFSYKDFTSPEKVRTYLLELRTGIPPVLSWLEIISYNRGGDIEWITKGLYQAGIILMFVLPFFFIDKRWERFLIWLSLTLIFFPSLLLIHPGNPQLYDVLMPVLLLGYVLISRWSFRNKGSVWITGLLAFLAGFFLSMAELIRPFILLIVPLLIGYNFFQYRKTSLSRFAIFLIPVLLFSGIWHVKLLYNHGQLIWSNHGGTNLYRAWAPVVDEPALKANLLPEEPPVNDYGWAWNNLNSETHARNSKIRQQAVISGILHHPGQAFMHLMKRIADFTRPQIDLYSHRPRAPVLTAYQIIVKILYILLAGIIIYHLYRIIRNWRQIFSEESIIIILAAFLTFIPVIGETDEEARFVISVLPLLMIVTFYGVRVIAQARINKKPA